MPKKDNLSTVRINKDLAETIDEVIKTEIGKKYGFRSRADFVTRACRQYLDETAPRFKHLNMIDDNVKIVDFTADRIATIYFRNGGHVCCDLCEGRNCEHIDYALEQPAIQQQLKQRGWKDTF